MTCLKCGKEMTIIASNDWHKCQDCRIWCRYYKDGSIAVWDGQTPSPTILSGILVLFGKELSL